jgi:hypothetical protein
MTTGELLTQLTIWAALLGYVIGATGIILLRRRPEIATRVRWIWTIACLFFLCHVIAAFTYYHHWRHSLAYAETARQTAELVGWSLGEGVYVSYFFTIAWVADVAWWWISAERYRRRSKRLSIALQGFFLFIVFNSTVVFETGLVRWFGLAITGWLILVFLFMRRQRPTNSGTGVHPGDPA